MSKLVQTQFGIISVGLQRIDHLLQQQLKLEGGRG